MTNKQMIKKHYTAYGKLIKKASACTNKRKALQSLKKKVRLLLDEGRDGTNSRYGGFNE